MTNEEYSRVYRRLNPRYSPYCPYERQRELHDLWPREQERFKKMVDTILEREDQ